MSERNTTAAGTFTPMQASMKAEVAKHVKNGSLALTITTVAQPVMLAAMYYYMRKSQDTPAPTVGVQATVGDSSKAITTASALLVGAIATGIVGNGYAMINIRQAAKKLE